MTRNSTMQHHEDEEHVSKKNTENNVLNTALFWSEQAETLLTLWTKTPQEIPFWSFRFQFPVGHSKDILPFDLGFCCAANRVKALAWVEQMQWRQPFQGEHAVCSGVDAEMNDPKISPKAKQKSSQHVPSLRRVDQGTATHSWPEKSDLNEAV